MFSAMVHHSTELVLLLGTNLDLETQMQAYHSHNLTHPIAATKQKKYITNIFWKHWAALRAVDTDLGTFFCIIFSATAILVGGERHVLALSTPYV